jgi:spore maturation protein CgeB
VVVKASGVGVFDRELLEGVLASARRDAIRVFWDVDAPATLAEMRGDPAHPLRRRLPELDAVFTYGGGPPVIRSYRQLGAGAAHTIYNGLDQETHFPVPPEERFRADLALLANRLPDRENRIASFFLEPAAALPERSFLLGGNGWQDKSVPANVRRIGHVYVTEHNALNCSALAVLNVARDSMAEVGFSPATRVFEAAGAGACIITDHWDGIPEFFMPGHEILVARDGKDVAELLGGLVPERAQEIGSAARSRALEAHTYARRAAEVDALLRDAIAARRREGAA